MSLDLPHVNANKNYKDDRGGTVLIPSAVVGIVKNNVDPLRSGRLKVYLNRLGSGDEENPNNWTTVSYMSPFFGYTPNTGSPDSVYGNYKDNPQSYGFWFTPPDIGTKVLCLFENGSADFGWYIGSLPVPGLTHMVPAIGSANSIVPGNEAEAKNYGGAKILPVGEINNLNSKTRYSNDPSEPRPVHSHIAGSLNNQGLIRDSDRGTISSSSMRESPSRVFGFSTPGRPIYQGGYNDATFIKAVKDPATPPDNFKVIGRIGGHSLVMDDGDVQGQDQLIRLRTAAGHMIMMNDTIGTFFIVHASGKSYIEMGKEGTIDMYSTNSVNIRTQGDLNLHADNNININAKKDLNISATNIKIESFENTTQYTGGTLQQQTKGDHTLKVDSKMTFASSKDSMIKSGGTNYIKGGPNVKLNTGESSLQPQDVIPIPQVAHTDTLFDKEKGYMAAPAKLPSIVSRAPAHSPWSAANLGVNVKTDLGADANLPQSPSSSVTAANQSANSDSTAPAVNVSLSSTVPGTSKNNSLISQAALNTQQSDQRAGLASDQVSNVEETSIKGVDGVKTPSIGPAGITPHQLEATGHLKPGTANAVVAFTTSGKSIENAMPPNVFTGKDGIKSASDLVNNTPAQVGVLTTLLDKSKSALTNAGVITGKESAGQIGGLILAGAQLGTQAVSDFVKATSTAINNNPNPSELPDPTNFLKSAGIVIPPILGKIAGSIKDAISSGNKAAEVPEKAAGPLSGAQIADNLKGAVSSAFDKIKKGFKSLKAGVPQNLETINAKNDEEKAAADAGETTPTLAETPPQTNAISSLKTSLSNLGDKIKSTLTKKSSSGVDNLPAGAASAGNIIDTQGITANNNSIPTSSDPYSGLNTDQVKALGNADPTDPYIRARLGLPSLSGSTSSATSLSLPGTGGISGILGSIKSGISSGADNLKGQIDSLKNKLTGDKKLTDVASESLGPAESAKLNAALVSIPTGGSPVTLPIIGENTFNASESLAQASNLLGDLKLPGINLGNGIPASAFTAPTAAQSAKYTELKAEQKKQEDLQWDLRKKYFDFKKKNGDGDSNTVAAKEEWQTCVKRIEEIKGEIYTNQTGSPPPVQAPPPNAPIDINRNLTVATGMQEGGAGRQAIESIGASIKGSLNQ
jgi:hypothetical protein